MRRALVLTTESARHPFRAGLPPCVLARAGEIEPTVAWRTRVATGLALSRRDVEGVAMMWVTGFVGALAFFA